jgi:uncharacterized protein YecE (DUF72 family)
MGGTGVSTEMAGRGKVYVGTAGFSYKDWRGPFYPEGMEPRQFLEYYAQKFPCVEIDFTYYRQPSAKTMGSMAGRVPPGFRFAVKAHRTITHEIPGRPELEKEMATFTEGVLPMAEAGVLACVLYQFPWSFKYTKDNLRYVNSLGKSLSVAPAVVEFRNLSWARDDVYKSLIDSGTGFCCVDEPNLRGLFPRVSLVTSNQAYVRFHGRNAAKWFNHKEAWERYDYLYTDEEMMPWVQKIRDMEAKADEVYVLFNNCHRGQAAVNAARMQALLGLGEPQEAEAKGLFPLEPYQR